MATISSDVELRVEEDAEAAAHAAARELMAAAAAGAQIALAGGSTPRRAYELAALLQPDWGPAGLWWGDERRVPPSDARSNYRLVRESLLDSLSRPPREIHRIRGELGAEEAARLYDDELRDVTLDLVLLGIGPDGHTASLFPDDAALDETERLAVPVQREDVERVTLTLPPLRAARRVVFLAVGDEKADAVQRAFAQPPSRETPASLVRGGTTVAILDPAAAARVR